MISFERRKEVRYSKHPVAARLAEGARSLVFNSRRIPGTTVSVAYRADERCQFVEMDGWWIYVSTTLGFEYYPELAQLLLNASALGLRATLKNLEQLRLLAFVAYCETTEHVVFGRSIDGLSSLYFGTEGSPLIVSDSRFEVAKRQGFLAFCKNDEEEWTLRARLAPEGSFLEGVNRCFAGIRYSSYPDGVMSARMMTIRSMRLDKKDSIDLLGNALLQAFSAYGSQRIALTLSGGIDSRVLLVGMLEAVRVGILRKSQIVCVSVLFPGQSCDESNEIKRVVDAAGIEWVSVDATPENVASAYWESMRLSGPPYPTSFMGTLWMQLARQRGARIIVSGHGGDEAFDYHLPDLLTYPIRKRIQRITQILEQGATSGFIDSCKGVCRALLGKITLRNLNRMLKPYAFHEEYISTTRPGMRLSLAMAPSYEMYAEEAAEQGFFLDTPFLRMRLMESMAPQEFPDMQYKGIAASFMETMAPTIAEIPSQKVSFDSILNDLFPPTRQNCGELDVRGLKRHATRSAYSSWRNAQEERDSRV